MCASSNETFASMRPTSSAITLATTFSLAVGSRYITAPTDFDASAPTIALASVELSSIGFSQDVEEMPFGQQTFFLQRGYVVLEALAQVQQQEREIDLDAPDLAGDGLLDLFSEFGVIDLELREHVHRAHVGQCHEIVLVLHLG